MDGQIITSSAAIDSNWIPDRNRFGLPKPPSWFLKRMWDMDAMLVILPSRQSHKYIIARRRERSRVLAGVIEKTLKKHKRTAELDADMLESLKLVQVDVIVGNVFTASWNPAMLADLKDRDMWAEGGADGYIAKIEGQEEAARLKKREAFLDDIDQRAKDAYRSYKARTGQRTRVTRNAANSKWSPSSRTAGSGSGIVITG